MQLREGSERASQRLCWAISQTHPHDHARGHIKRDDVSNADDEIMGNAQGAAIDEIRGRAAANGGIRVWGRDSHPIAHPEGLARIRGVAGQGVGPWAHGAGGEVESP